MRNRWIRWSWAIFACVAAPTALASQLDGAQIGQSIPYWTDGIADINDDGDVAWTAQDATTGGPAAKLYGSDGQLVHLTDTAIASERFSHATGVSERSSDQRLWVTGFRSSQLGAMNSEALLWRVNMTPATPTVSVAANLAEAFPSESRPAQTMAKSFFEGSGGTIYVAGHSRVRVSNEHLPLPTLWTIQSNNGSVTSTSAQVLGGLVARSAGTLVGAVQAGSQRWACGHISSPGTYAQATCWNLNAGANSPTNLFAPDDPRLPFTVASSVVNRVRALPVGDNGAVEAVVVGTLISDTGRYHGFSYNLASNELVLESGFSAGVDSMIFDAGAFAYPSSSGVRRGVILAGVSTTTSIGPPETTKATEGYNAVMRGTHYRGFHGAALNSGVTCDVNLESEQGLAGVGALQQLLTLSPNGQFRLTKSQGALVRNMVYETPAEVQVYQRDTRVRLSEGQTPAGASNSTAQSYRYYQIGMNSPHSRVFVRMATSLGCEAVDNVPGLLACADGSEAAFDLAGGSNNWLLSRVAALNNRLASASQSGTFDLGLNMMQVAYQQDDDASGTQCSVSPIQAAPVEVEVLHNPPQDADGTVWHDCEGAIPGHDTDVQQSFDHCGACNNSANDGLICTTNSCVSGERRAVANANNGCWVNHNGQQFGQGVCAATGDREFAASPCSVCQPSTSATSYTTVNHRAPFYRCIAHHDSTAYSSKDGSSPNSCGAWAFFSESNCTSPSHSSIVSYRLDDYRTSHFCARHRNDIAAATTDVNAGTHWQQVANPQALDEPVWPTSFWGLKSKNSDPNNFSNTIETRQWLFNYRLRYLGQLNTYEHGSTHNIAPLASTIYLAPNSEPEWFLFYVNDHDNRRDKVSINVEFDSSQMELDVHLHYICAGGGATNGIPRLDGVRYCGPSNASDFGTTCSREGNNANTRHAACQATTAKNNMITIEGGIDCGEDPRKTGWFGQGQSADRDGWALVRIARRNVAGKNDPKMCTPITLSVRWWSDLTTSNAPVVCW